MRESSRSGLGFLAIASACAVGFVALSRAVAKRQTVAKDRMVRSEVQQWRAPASDAVASGVGLLGKSWLTIPATAALARQLVVRDVGARSALPLVASLTAEGVARALDKIKPYRHVPPGHPDQHKDSFPSGHATKTTAAAMTSAYVLTREQLVDPGPAFASAAIVALASPLSRLYLDRHWPADVIAGWLLGGSIAAGCAALYELSEPPMIQMANHDGDRDD
jgi:membrane-associated phospholipid phosphatase